MKRLNPIRVTFVVWTFLAAVGTPSFAQDSSSLITADDLVYLGAFAFPVGDE